MPKRKMISSEPKPCSASPRRVRDQGDRTGASINYSEAITVLRSGSDLQMLAFALRHAADVRSELREYASASALIDEAIRLYRTVDASALDLANALRVSALNSERQARVAWREARNLYTSVATGNPAEDAGVKESTEHLERLNTEGGA